MFQPDFIRPRSSRRVVAPLTIAALIALAPAAPAAATVVLPWIAQTRGAVAHASELHVHNPGRAPLTVSFELRRPDGAVASSPRVRRTLEPGATWQLADAERQLFGRSGGPGFLVATVEPGAAEPILRSTTIDSRRDGASVVQGVPPMGEDKIAVPGQVQYVVSLGKLGRVELALWMYNPSGVAGEYDVLVRGLDGSELGTAAVTLGPGKLRQLNPSHLPLPTQGGFTLEIRVESGALLSAAVVEGPDGLPVLVEGETR